MLKLAFWLIVACLVYFYYRGRQAHAAQRDRELAEREAELNRRTYAIDVEAEEIEAER